MTLWRKSHGMKDVNDELKAAGHGMCIVNTQQTVRSGGKWLMCDK